VKEQTWILDPTTGDLLVEGLTVEEAPALAGDLLPGAREMGCARPLTVLPPLAATAEEIAKRTCVRVAGYYHNSLVEGPGRRSSLLVGGCDLGCRGCWVPFLHPSDAGTLVPVERLADVLLDPAYERDGVSILGGEPMQQPEGVLALVRALRARGCPHIVVYSGYTYERLQRMARRESVIGCLLNAIDVLIDGPFVPRLAHGADPWTGSANQRVLMLRGA
jgi:anaerobic ribonucleoside-triphosphate reductase activating protein